MSHNCNRSRADKYMKLDEESLNLVLSKLPAKSVLRFRMACRLWNTITRESYFANLHLRHWSDKDGTVIILETACKSEFSLYRLKGSKLSLNFRMGGIRKSDRVTAISNSYNGLVCVFTYGDTLLVNPCTREFVVLPKCFCGGRVSSSFGGLGFDVSTGKYKVVKLHSDLWKRNLECEMFTIGSHSWRKIDDTPFLLSNSTPVFNDGSFFWADDTHGVLVLDIQKEVFREIPFPKKKRLSRESSICELEGHLCLADKEWASAEMDIFVLRKSSVGGSDWDLLYTIDLRRMDGWSRAYSGQPLALWDGKIVLADKSGRLDYYDIQSKRFTKQDCWNGKHWCHAVVHVQSLISPHALQQGTSSEDCDADHPYVLLPGATVPFGGDTQQDGTDACMTDVKLPAGTSSGHEGKELDEEDESNREEDTGSETGSDSEADSDSSSETGSTKEKTKWIVYQWVGEVRVALSGHTDGRVYDLYTNCCIGTWSDGPRGGARTYVIHGHHLNSLVSEPAGAWLDLILKSRSQLRQPKEQRE